MAIGQRDAGGLASGFLWAGTRPQSRTMCDWPRSLCRLILQVHGEDVPLPTERLGDHIPRPKHLRVRAFNSWRLLAVGWSKRACNGGRSRATFSIGKDHSVHLEPHFSVFAVMR